MNIYNINLNLLKTFSVLIQERSVSRAAKRLHITQPAMSNSLNQLRELFKDQILIRGAKGMIPTQEALNLAPKIERVLLEVERILFYKQKFEYQTETRIFKIGMNDYTEFIILPKLYELIKEKAPNISLKIIACLNFSQEKFENGDIELGIGMEKKLPKFIKSEILFTDSPVCVAHHSNPIFKKQLTLQNYLLADHLAINNQSHELSLTDKALSELKLERKIKLSLPHLLPSLQALANTELVGTLPERMIIQSANLYQLKYKKLPFSIPKISIAQFWHVQQAEDSGLLWLRTIIHEVCNKF